MRGRDDGPDPGGPFRGGDPDTWSAKELRAFLASTEGDRLHACWHLAASTGLRRGEILGLRWGDIDMDGGRLSVRRARVAAGNEVTEGVPKSGQARVVDLDPRTVAVLRQHRRHQLEERLAWGDAWVDTGYVFTREGTGEPLHPHSLRWFWVKALRSADVRPLRFHDLRHSHATLGLAAGVPAKVMQERLGHSSIAITMDIYSHVVPGMQADAAAKFDALVFG